MDVPVGMGPGDCGNGRSGAAASRCTSFAYSSRRESFDLSGSESIPQMLRRRLVSRHSAPDWRPPPSHILLCGGVVRMSACVEQLMRLSHTGVKVVALCNVPSEGSAAFQTWASRAAPLLASPQESLTLVRGSELEKDDLLFAGANSARAVLIFAPVLEVSTDAPAATIDDAIVTAKQTADCMTVLTALRVRHVSPSAFTCSEMHVGANARFFRLTHKATFSSGWRSLQMLTKNNAASLQYLSRQQDREASPAGPDTGGDAERKVKSDGGGSTKNRRSSWSSAASGVGRHSEGAKDSSLPAAAAPAPDGAKPALPAISARPSFHTLVRQAAQANDVAPSLHKPEKKARGPELSDEVVDEGEMVRGRQETQMKAGLSKHLKGSDLHLSRVFAGGHVFTEGLLDKLLCQSYYNPRIPEVIEMLLGAIADGTGRSQDAGGRPQLHLRPTPAKMRGKSFSALFAQMLRDDAVQTIGIYRTRRDEQGVQVRYVFTKPPSETVMLASDFIFALGHLAPDEHTKFSLRLSQTLSLNAGCLDALDSGKEATDAGAATGGGASGSTDDG